MTNKQEFALLKQQFLKDSERIDALVKKPYAPPQPPRSTSADDGLGSWPTDPPQIARVPLVSSAAAVAWRADAEARQAAKEAETERRQVADWLQRSNSAVYVDQQLDDKIRQAVDAAIAAEHELMIEVVGKALAKVKQDVLNELADAISQLQEQDVRGRGDKAARVIDLPGPFIARRKAS
jgi:6-phosphofructokinase